MNDRGWILIRGGCIIIIGILIAVNVIAVVVSNCRNGLRIVVTVIVIAIGTAASNGRKER